MDIPSLFLTAIGMTAVYFVTCLLLLVFVDHAWGSTRDDGSRTIVVVACLVFFVVVSVALATSTTAAEYQRMKAELEAIQKQAVAAGLGQFKEVVVQTKQEFILGSFTAEAVVLPVASGARGE